ASIVEADEPAPQALRNGRRRRTPESWVLLPFLALFTLVASFRIGRSLRLKQAGPAAAAGGFCAFLYLMAGGAGMTLAGYVVLLSIDAFAAWVGYNTDPNRPRDRGHGGNNRSNGWVWGPSSGGSSWSGGGFGGGGWGGFGGGHSGGGGASGGW
ncbi:MAG: hypothetical protein KDA75_14575, partial [Planctomycetaceae bacterium]|nr:hypothetical protein [Planctomycetaceae bacterium]